MAACVRGERVIGIVGVNAARRLPWYRRQLAEPVTLAALKQALAEETLDARSTGGGIRMKPGPDPAARADRPTRAVRRVGREPRAAGGGAPDVRGRRIPAMSTDRRSSAAWAQSTARSTVRCRSVAARSRSSGGRSSARSRCSASATAARCSPTCSGGSVEPAPEAEIGWHTSRAMILSWSPRAVARVALPALHPAARTHASWPGRPTACRRSRGPHLGTQFHPESTIEIVKQWADSDSERLERSA